jgi:hemoglobin
VRAGPDVAFDRECPSTILRMVPLPVPGRKGYIRPMPQHPHHENPDPTPDDIRAHAAAARERKRAEAAAIGIDDDFVSRLVDGFYTRIRADDLLGPIFGRVIADWPPHLERMKAFWRSILMNTGEFSGNPMARHLAIGGLEPHHFCHWLGLFYAALDDLDPHPDAKRTVAARARMIADSLLTGIRLKEHGLAGAGAGEALPYV